jgi:hypothetical protein
LSNPPLVAPCLRTQIASMEYGSLEWARSRNGALVGREAAAEALRMVVARLRRALRRDGAALELGTPEQAELALREVRLPATQAVSAVHAVVVRLGPPPLVNHVLRTFVLGSVLGQRDGLRWDPELFATAALLHDVALSCRSPQRTCFAHDGAEVALQLLAAEGMDIARRSVVADAICYHLRVEVPVELGVEAHLVHAGAGLDVVGRRRDELPRATQAAVLVAHPRGDFTSVLDACFAREVKEHPTARISRWMAGGFGTLYRRHPWDRRAPIAPPRAVVASS